MSNSSLVDYKKLSPNHYSGRNHSIDTITIHCVVGQCSVETLGSIFASSSREASSNYGIGYDGKIGMYVEEKNASWCSSSYSNDNRAVTIEVASDTYAPYEVNDEAYNALINLVADICKRNGIKKLVWSKNKSDRMNHKNGCNMTVHRDYANKSCPGDYLYNRMGDIANKVNKKLGAKTTTTNSKTTTSKPASTSTNKGNSNIKSVQKWLNTNYKAGLTVDGIYGNLTKKALVKALQTELNKQYGAKLVVDGIYGNATNSAVRNISNGCRGNITKTLQGLLICNGYSTNGFDGIFGNGTAKAVKSYQKKKGLTVDGVAGKNTLSALCK